MTELLKRLKELRERAEDLRGIPSDDFTEELLAELESNNNERDRLTRSLAAMHTANDIDEEEDRTSNGPIPGQGTGDVSNQENRGDPCIDQSYRSMFGGEYSLLSSDGFRNQNDFLEVLHSGRFDDRLTRSNMGEGVGEDGGFSVPEEFAAKWMDDSLENEIVRPLAQVWSMKAPVRKVPGWDGKDHSSGTTHGGFAMQWLAEKATGTRQVAKMTMINLKAKKAGIYAQISKELAADGLGFENQLTTALVKSIGFGLDGVFLFGSGTGCTFRQNPRCGAVWCKFSQGLPHGPKPDLRKWWGWLSLAYTSPAGLVTLPGKGFLSSASGNAWRHFSCC